MKKWMYRLMIAGLVVVLSGCGLVGDLWEKAWTNTYDEDYTKTHKAFLDHTLGGWRVVKKQHKHYSMKNENEMNEDYIAWDIQYKDKNGGLQTLHLENNEDMGKNVINYAEGLLKNEFEGSIGKPDWFHLQDPYLTTSWSDSTLAYKKHPEKLNENYKEAFKFSDFTFNRPFEHSPAYLSLSYKWDEKEVTDEQKAARWRDIREKILKLAPNINMQVELVLGENKRVFLNFANGKQIEESDIEKYLRDQYKEFDESDLGKEK